MTLFLAISQTSHVLSFHSCAAIAYSSINASCQAQNAKERKVSINYFMSHFAGILEGERHALWCSGTAWGHQWTVRHTGPYGGTLLVGSWSTPETGCCCSEETWQWVSGPGSKGTAALDSAEVKMVKEGGV